MAFEVIIDLYFSCWDNADLLPFLFRHYDPFVRRYVAFDDGSTDGSLDILRSHPKVELRSIPAGHADQAHSTVALPLSETVWRERSMDADWIMMCDVDEHLYHADLINYLERCKAQGITIIPALGYQMLSDSFPVEGLLSDQVRRGAPFDKMSKLNVFDPKAIERLNYTVGRHQAAPTGRVVAPDEDELLNLHFKYLEFERVMRRHTAAAARLNDADRQRSWGHRWRFSREELRADWAAFEERAIDVMSEPRPAESHREARWWDRYRRSRQDVPAVCLPNESFVRHG